MPSDLELLQAWRRGDSSAGGELFSRHFSGLLRFFFNKVDDREVEDLIQKTLLACVGSKDAFRGEAKFRTYLLAVARNELLMFYRRRDARPQLDPAHTSIADLAPSPSTIARLADDRRLLLQALRHLPADQQLLLELHYWEDLPAAELAQVFDIEPTTVRTRLHRARKQLKDLIERHSRDPALRSRALEGLETWGRDLHHSAPA